MRTLLEWQHAVHQNAVDKGWYEEKRSSLELYALMVTEVAEATEEVRNHKADYYEENGKPEGESVELADLVLRIFDYTGAKKLNLQESSIKELNYLFNVTTQEELTINSIGRLIESNRKDIEQTLLFKNFLSTNNDLDKHMIINMYISKAAEEYSLGLNETEALSRILFLVTLYFNDKKWNLENILNKKHNFNVNRPYKHGGKKC